MQRFKNILLLVDEGEISGSAVARAAALARRNSARVTALASVEAMPWRRSDQGDLTSDLAARVYEEARGRSEALAAELRAEGVKAAAKAVTGPRFVEIIRLVLREQHDLVMLTTGGEGLRDRLLGSTARHLMRKCPCPVWAIKPNGERYPRIVAAIDPDPSVPGAVDFSRKVLTLSSSLARTDMSELHVVHAWSLYGESLLRRRGSTREVEAMARSARKMHQTQLEELLAEFSLDDLEHRVHLLRGDPGPTITEATETIAPDLVVIGTVGRAGLAGFFIGNTAEAVLDHADCSVLAVKPDGFVTPVTL